MTQGDQNNKPFSKTMRGSTGLSTTDGGRWRRMAGKLTVGQLLLGAGVLAGGLGFAGGWGAHAHKSHGVLSCPAHAGGGGDCSGISAGPEHFEVHIGHQLDGLGPRIEAMVERQMSRLETRFDRHGDRERRHAHGQRPRLGVEIRDAQLVEDQVEVIREHDKVIEKRIKGRRAPQVVHVQSSSPAQQAGIEPGDFLLEVAGRDIRSARELQRRLSSTCGKRALAVVVQREGERLELSVPPR